MNKGLYRIGKALAWLAIGWALTAAGDDALDLTEADALYRLKEQITTVGEDGLKQVRIKHIIEILQPDALDYMGDVEIPYNAHYQKVRLVRAETVTPGGERLAVQDELIHDQIPESQAAYAEYSDSRQLVFSMPGLTVGAVIEYEVERIDTEPIIDGEYGDDFTFDEFAPVRESRYELRTPADQALRVHVIGDPSHTSTTNEGVRIDRWEQRDIPALVYEPGMPPLAEVRPSIHVTTISSWQVVDAWYRDLLGDRGALSPEIRQLAAELTDGLTNTIDRINALSHYTQQSVRYVAIELGQGAYQPRPAADCLRHLYGDCKDQSVLLIALLRAIDIDAEIALIRPRDLGAVLLEQPTPSQFNHAVVVVPRTEGDLWLDPTAPFIDAESYSAIFDDVHALVIPREPPSHDPADAASWFSHVSPLPLAQCRTITTYEVQLSPDGMHPVKKSVTGFGRHAAAARFQLFSQTEEELKETFEDYAKDEAGFARLLDWTFDPLDRLTPSFTHTIHYLTEGLLEPSATGFSTLFSAANLDNLLEVEWWDTGENRRTYDWIAHSYAGDSIDFRVLLPPGYALAKSVSPYKGEVPQGQIEIRTEQVENIARTRVDVHAQPVRIDAAQYKSVKRKTDRTIQRGMRTVEYADRAEVYLKDLKPHAARQVLRDALADHPEDPYVHYRLGRNLQRCGYLVAAREAYEEAIARKPDVLSFYTALAGTYSGTVGIPGKGYRRDQVLAVLDRALPHVQPPSNVELQRALALATNDDGEPFGPGSDAEAPIAILDRLLEDDEEDVEALVLRGHGRAFLKQYDDAVDDFSRALDLQPDHMEAYVARWRNEALTGNVESAIEHLMPLQNNAMGQFQLLSALGIQLADAGRIDDAVHVVEVASSLPGIPAAIARNGLAEFEQLDETNLRDYSTYREYASPESAFLTLMSGIFYDDPETIRDALTTHVDLPCESLHSFPLAGAISHLGNEFRNVSLATLMCEENVARTDLPSGDVYLSVERRTGGANAGGFKLGALLTREGETWKVADFSQTIGPCRIVTGILHHHIQSSDLDAAWPLINYLQDFYQDGSTDDAIVNLLNTPFANRTNQVMAVAAAGLLSFVDSAQRESAVSYLERALAEEPDHAFGQNLLGLAHLTARRFDRAAASFSHALRLDPDNEQYATLNLGALMAGGHLAQAESALHHLEQQFPAAVGLPGMKMTYELKAGNLEEAGRLEKQVRRERSRFDPGSRTMQLYVATEDLPALERIENDLAMNQGQTETRFDLAEAYMALHRWNDAARQLEAMLLIDPSEWHGRMKLAEVLILKGRHAEARAMVSQIIDLAYCPDRVNVSHLHHGLGDFDQAAARYLEEDKELPFADSAIFMNLFGGVASTQAGRIDDGRRHFETALAAGSPGAYPAVFAEHFLGTRSFEEVMAVVDACEDHQRRAEMRCEAAYYGAMKAQFDDNPDRARDLFLQAADTRAADMIEFFLAHAELARANGGEPAPL